MQNGGEAAERHQARMERFIARNRDLLEHAVVEARRRVELDSAG